MPEVVVTEETLLPAPVQQRLWPVATVMATGILATTLVQLQGLGYLLFSDLLLKRMGLNSDQAATFFVFLLPKALVEKSESKYIRDSPHSLRPCIRALNRSAEHRSARTFDIASRSNAPHSASQVHGDPLRFSNRACES